MRKILYFMILISTHCDSQITGIWRCNFDTIISGISMKSNDYYIFNNDKKVFNFSIGNDESATKFYCFSLNNYSKNQIILNFKPELTNKYSCEDESFTVYANDETSIDLFDTIEYDMLSSSKMLILNKALGFNRMYVKISNGDTEVPEPSDICFLRSKFSEIDNAIKNKQFTNAKSNVDNIFDLWIMKNNILFLFFMEDENLKSIINKNDKIKIEELLNLSISEDNNRLSKKYFYSLLYLKMNEKELSTFQNKIKWDK